MAEKSLDHQIADLEAEITKKKAEQEKLRLEAAHQDYPKYIKDPSDPTGATGATANSAAEEKAINASYEQSYAANKKKRDLDKKIEVMRAEADKAEADARDAAAEKAFRVEKVYVKGKK